MIRKAGIAGGLLALLLAGQAPAKDALPQVKIAVGGANCLCYLPTVLAQQLGNYEAAGVEVELINFKGGQPALTAVLGGSADVVSGYYDHCVNLAAKNKQMQAFVTYDHVPGFVLVVAPKEQDNIKSVKDLVGKKVGVTAPGSSTDFFVKYLLAKNGIDPTKVAVIGIGSDATAVAAVEQNQVEAAVVLDPVATLLQGRHKDLRILSDTRALADTVAVFGGEYPGGALYAQTEWIAKHPQEAQALTDAVVSTLKWIHSHSPEEIMAKMPDELIGPDKALYLAALRNTIPIYSGGMRKRVAIAQSWIVDPRILLMDEPFAALDVQTRQNMENELLGLWQESRKTVLFITHDLEEAIALADRVIVLTAGPARIKGDYVVDLPRPRDVVEIRLNSDFTALYRQIWADLRDEVKRSLHAGSA